MADYELAPGQMVGEYRIERKIGEGGFGKVYAAVHPVIGKAAAVKVLNPELARNTEMVSRFIAEARAVNQIRHRNIIDIFAFGTLPGGLNYFVMELLEGMTLDAYLKKNGPLDPGFALGILSPIGRALVAAHKAGITHRDLKPENVFLVIDQDGAMFPKLLDFGIAKLLHDSEMAHRTKTGAMMGTPVYMSPEQCKGSNIDHRSDIYSFGVMVHEVLTGNRPFTGENLMELLVKQVSEPAPPMSSSRPGLPRALDAAVLHMLEKSADRRPDSMQAAMDELVAAARSAGLDVPASVQASGPVASPQRASAPVLGSPAAGASHAGVDTNAWIQGQSAGASATQAAQARSAVQHTPSLPHAPQGHYPPSAQHAPSGQHIPSGQYTPAGPPVGHPGAAPQYGAQGAPGQGYPAGYPSGPTLQSAGNAPARKSGATGIYAAIAGGLFLLFFVLLVGRLAFSGSSGDVEIGAEAPDVGSSQSHESKGNLSLSFTPPGSQVPSRSVQIVSHRRYQVTVKEVGSSRVTRAEIQYGDNEIETTWSGGGGTQSEVSPAANRSFVLSNSSGALLVTTAEGASAGQRESKDVIEDIGPLFKPRPEVLGHGLAVGDSVSPSSDVVVDLLNLASDEDGVTVRADNATFKLVSADSAGATFEVGLLFVREEVKPPLVLKVPLKGNVTFNLHTGLPSHGSLTGPVEGTFTDGTTRFAVSGTLVLESQ